VLVDPPCSGLGTLQAHPDLRWRVTPQSIAEMAPIQAEILRAGAAAVRPGGVLVYATCTISPTENERLIAAFLDSHPDFVLDGPAPDRVNIGQPAAAVMSGAASCHDAASANVDALLTLPHHDHTAGFYIARLRRS
jgi:16S rRNA (cytosine967-C5)-methyltransferase